MMLLTLKKITTVTICEREEISVFTIPRTSHNSTCLSSSAAIIYRPVSIGFQHTNVIAFADKSVWYVHLMGKLRKLKVFTCINWFQIALGI